MYREFSGESPSAARSFLIALFRLCSKSTKVSEDHSLRRISSRVITSPGFSSKTERMQKGWPGKRMRTPCLRNSRAARFTWKSGGHYQERETSFLPQFFAPRIEHFLRATLTWVRNRNPI